jgi:hypothetical protein
VALLGTNYPDLHAKLRANALSLNATHGTMTGSVVGHLRMIHFACLVQRLPLQHFLQLLVFFSDALKTSRVTHKVSV